ncbi:MAG: hypothetical protein FJ100_16520 [Deltaproteobacteria bacterium]|nr:hypothetical protein [Deltaproteobacteria bacterium]
MVRPGALVVVALAVGCGAQAGEPVRDLAGEARALVHGMGAGRNCLGDQHCTFGAVRGVCALGTCLGLLSADQRPQRRVVLERLAAADTELSVVIAASLLRAVAQPELSTPSHLAVVEGLGVLWRRSGCRDASLAAPIRAAAGSREATLAVTARVQLGHCGDPQSLPDLLEDAATGSELLRAETCAALAGHAQGPQSAKAHAALVERLDDPSPVVQRAAVVALRRWPAPLPAAVEADLRARAPHLSYLLGAHRARPTP